MVNGLVVVDKDPGWTSHDVVARCRRLFAQRRVGHAGTLDPDATGVLLVGLGRATRLLRFLTPLAKTYRAEIVLGTATDTLDASGTVVGRWDMRNVSLEDARQASGALSGEILQVPPMVSALRVGGRRLHTLARQGVEVERQARPVTVHRLELSATDDPGILGMEVTCSAGTYVRVLAADLGTALGGGAHVRALRRISVGPFDETEARRLTVLAAGAEHRSPAELVAAVVLPPAAMVRHLEAVTASAELAGLIRRGLPLDRVSLGIQGGGPWALLDAVGTLLAVYEGTDTDRVRPAVVLGGQALEEV
jgi:tRNA pseudouridine55 synthase